MPVTIYIKDGPTVELAHGNYVRTNNNGEWPNYRAVEVLDKEEDGTRIASFREASIVGWVVRPEPQPRHGAV